MDRMTSDNVRTGHLITGGINPINLKTLFWELDIVGDSPGSPCMDIDNLIPHTHKDGVNTIDFEYGIVIRRPNRGRAG